MCHVSLRNINRCVLVLLYWPGLGIENPFLFITVLFFKGKINKNKQSGFYEVLFDS